MFTGIITDIGTVTMIDLRAGDWRIGIRTAFDLDKISIGASIACAGCCLTVVEKKQDVFFVDVSSESLSKTNLKSLQVGTRMNLEQSLKMGDELGGHMVSGHVDGLARIVSVMQEGDSHRLVIEAPKSLAGMIAPKGSVALDGVSLTVNDVHQAQFGVNIIPHTWTHTTFGGSAPDQTVHLEVDMLARYVARALACQA